MEPDSATASGDHVDFSHGVFFGEVIGKKEEHHHHAAAPVAPRPPRFLPAGIPDFIGREDHLAALDHLASAPVGRGTPTVIISAIDGTPGVGKTTLAVHWAHSAEDRFPDGQIHLDLQGYAPTPAIRPRRALGELLQMLGLPADRIPSTVEARSRIYRDALAGRRVLIVLDNAADPDHVRPLLPGAPGSLVVITSRSRLSGLAVRDGAHLITLDTLSPAEAIALFTGVLGTDRVAAEPEAALRVAQACGFLPLALRIAVVRLAGRPAFRFADVLAELEPEDERLEYLSRGADEHAAVRHVFSWSYARLSPEERRAFRLLSLHRGASISAEAAEAVLGRPRQATLRLLDALAEVHLLETDRPRRYRFHDLLRLYAHERYTAEGPDEPARERLLSWYVASGENADQALNDQRRKILDPWQAEDVRPLTFTDADAALLWFDEESSNLLDVAQQAADNGLFALSYRVPILLWSFFQRRSRWTEWLEVQELGLASARAAADAHAEAWLLGGLGDVYDDLERYDDAVECHTQALEVHRALDDRNGEATALNNIGVSLDNLERYAEAIECYESAVAIFTEQGHESGIGMVLNNLGAAHLLVGDRDKAADCYRRALESRRRIGDDFGAAMTLFNLADVHEEYEEYEQAAALYREALAAHRGVGHLRGEARALHRLGVSAQMLGRRQEALQSLRLALEIFEDVGDPDADDVLARLEELREV